MTDHTARATGRTTRAIVASMCAMLRGEKVIHISHNIEAAQAHFNAASDWLAENGWCTDKALAVLPLVANLRTRTLFFGSGSVIFQPRSANLRGFRAEIIKDHYVLELEQAEKEHQQLLNDASLINDLLAKHQGKLQLRVIAGGHTYQVRGK